MQKAQFSRCLPALGLTFLLALPALAQVPGTLQPGDTVAICGDSITEQKQYSVFIEDYLLMCQPQPKLQAMQFGWGGETSWGFLARMKNDVLPFAPSVATTCYGMNDGGYTALTPDRSTTYKNAMTEVVKNFKAAGVRFIVVGTPGAVDTTTYKRPNSTADVYNQTLAGLGDVAKQVAADQGVAFADVHTPMMEAMAKAKAKYGDNYPVAGNDGVHPGANGHLVMAYAFLKGLGCTGDIGTLTFDAKAGTATGTDGQKIVSANAMGFKVESTRYPFCFYGDNNGTRGMVDMLPFNEDLNRYKLVVKNAPAARVKVTWGTVSKEYAAADLEKGINLAAEFLDNPFSQPFATVDQAVRVQQNWETPAFKGLMHSIPDFLRILPEDGEYWKAVPGKIVAQAAKARATASASVTPVPHEIKIEPVK